MDMISGAGVVSAADADADADPVGAVTEFGTVKETGTTTSRLVEKEVATSGVEVATASVLDVKKIVPWVGVETTASGEEVETIVPWVGVETTASGEEVETITSLDEVEIASAEDVVATTCLIEVDVDVGFADDVLAEEVLPLGESAAGKLKSSALVQPVFALRAAGQDTCSNETVGLSAPPNQSNRQ